MKFYNTGEVIKRLGQTDKLTREELHEIPPHVPGLATGDPNRLLNRYFAELFTLLADDLASLDTAIDRSREAISRDLELVRSAMDENRKAVKSFDETSGRLSKRIYWLTWGVFVLTGVLVVLTTGLVVLTIVKH